MRQTFEDASNGHTHYTAALGGKDLRKEICKHYKKFFSYNIDVFGNSGEGYIRIALTVGIEKLEEAFDRLLKEHKF